MKRVPRNLPRFALTGAIVTALLFSAAAPAVAVGEDLIPDPAFHACLERAIADRGDVGGVTLENLARLTLVPCPNEGITSVAGAEYLTNVRIVSLANNAITDISPIGHLLAQVPTDEFLLAWVTGNHIADFSSLSPRSLEPGVGFGMFDGTCQTIDLGTIPAGTSAPLTLRDLSGNPMVIYDATSPMDPEEQVCTLYHLPHLPIPPIPLPDGVTWDGTALVADPSLVGETVSFAAGGKTSAFGSGGGGVSARITFTVGPPLPAPAPAVPAKLPEMGASPAPLGWGALGLLSLGGLLLLARQRGWNRGRQIQ